MKNQRWIIGAGILLLLLGGGCWVLDRVAYQPFSRRVAFAELATPTPLIYLQVSRLQERVAHLRSSPDYQTFLHSDAATQLQQAPWWPVFRENFEAFWHSLIIDPMRIIGSEAAMAVYETPVGELLPPAILVGRVDRVARIAERVLYGYDRLAHQVGITFFQTYRRVVIYKIEQPDMICPLYYALMGDTGMIATALPLVHDTLDRLLKRIAQPVAADSSTSPLPTLIGTIPADRLLTGYIELSRLINEFHQNSLLRTFGWFQDSAWQPQETFPQILWRVDTTAHQIAVKTEWFTDAAPPAPSESVAFTSAPEGDVPLVIARYQQAFTRFSTTWQQWFPAWQWDFGSLIPESIENMYGEIVECQLADQLVGTGLPYPLPDVSCIVDTHDSEASAQLLETMVQQILTSTLPPLLRQSVNVVKTPYQNTTILKIQFLFQELLSYAVTNGNVHQPKPGGYTLFSTSGKNVRLSLDRLRDQPGKPPYTLRTPPSPTAILAVIHPGRLANLLRTAMQTNTMKLAVPPRSNGDFYRVAPAIIRAIEPLPPATLATGTTRQGLYIEIYMYPSDFNDASDRDRGGTQPDMAARSLE